MILADANINRYSLEIRALLDLLQGELYRIGADSSSVKIITPFEDLEQDLLDRLHGRGAGTVREVAVYLLSLEEGAPWPRRSEAERVLVAFRNRLSHKPLLYPAFRGLNFLKLEAFLRRTYPESQAYGVFGPQCVAQLALANLAARRGYFDYSFYLSDRAVTSPVHQGPIRYVCPYGLLRAGA